MKVRLLNIVQRLRASLWTIPLVMSVGAAVLATVTARLDAAGDASRPDWLAAILYDGDLDGARVLMSTVASSMITVAGVAFSTTVVALSLASSQFGPRLLIGFMRDRGNQFVLGTFVATFLYCLMALRGGDSLVDPVVVPVIGTTVALFLSVCSLGVFIYFIHHISSSMHAEHVVETVARDLAAAIDRICGGGDDADVGDANVGDDDRRVGVAIRSHKDGYIRAIDEAGLVNVAERGDLFLRLRCRAGKFVVTGDTLAEVLGSDELERDLVRKIRRHILIGRRRTDDQDPEYGIHQLVEVALRALSPGVNDPYTAITCVDWLGATLTSIGRRGLQKPRRRGANGVLRLVLDPITFDGMLSAAFDQIRQNAVRNPAVAIRILEALDSMGRHLPDSSHRASVRVQADMTFQGALSDDLQEKDRLDLTARYRSVVEVLDATTPRDDIV